MIQDSSSIAETNDIASAFAREIVGEKPSIRARVIALEGELGAGKTTFVQAFARALGVTETLTSPTFVILKSYFLPARPVGGKAKSYQLLFHIDAYRLKDYKELEALGIDEIIKNPENIVLIEWADRVSEVLPKEYISIHLDHINENTRKIQIIRHH